jgi:SAM-dependent methyltransferase
MNETNERTSKQSIFSYQRSIFRYKLTKKFLLQGTILDIGCGGEGLIFDFISQEQYTGLDYSPKTIKKISSEYTDAKFVCQKSPPLDFPDSTFDNVLCFEMIEHIPEKEAPILLEEIFRCLIKGGKLLLTTPNASNRGKTLGEGHIKEYSVDEMEDLIVNAGFTITKRSGLFLRITDDRTGPDMYSKFRAKLYESLHPKSQESNVRTIESDNIKKDKASLPFHKKLLKKALIGIAKLVCFMGYIFPNKAEYQIWLVEKK